MSALLVIPDEALVHALVVLLDAFDPQHAVLVAQWLAILQPGDGLDGIALDVAGEGGRSAEVDGLAARLDLGREWRCHGQHGLDALAAHRVVDDAQVLARVLDLGLKDDEGAANLAHAVV